MVLTALFLLQINPVHSKHIKPSRRHRKESQNQKFSMAENLVVIQPHVAPASDHNSIARTQACHIIHCNDHKQRNSQYDIPLSRLAAKNRLKTFGHQIYRKYGKAIANTADQSSFPTSKKRFRNLFYRM